MVNDIGSDPEAHHYPGATPEGAEAIVRTAIEAYGRVDILINNAGISVGAPLDTISPHDIQRHMDINLMDTIWCSRAAWPHMKAKGHGRIVNTTSSSMTGFADQAAYAARKGGVWSLTQALAAEGAAL